MNKFIACVSFIDSWLRGIILTGSKRRIPRSKVLYVITVTFDWHRFPYFFKIFLFYATHYYHKSITNLFLKLWFRSNKYRIR